MNRPLYIDDPAAVIERVITVTWMDGKVEVYRGVSRHQVENGVLTIGRMRGSAGTLHLPLANIRQVTVE
jgi:hypothetical protein